MIYMLIMGRTKSFDEARKDLINKYNFIDLIEYNGSNKICLFKDVDFGNFEGKYSTVLIGRKRHPKRSKILKLKYTKETNIKKYGCENVSQNKEIRLKIINKCIEKYGVENPLKSDIIKNNIKKTNIIKYGNEYAIASDIVKEKILKTNIQKYNVENVFSSDIIKDKIKISMLNKYGVEHALQNQDILNKMIENNKKKYGVDFCLNLDSFKDKTIKTNMIKYGVENPLKLDIIKNKIKETNIRYGNLIVYNGVYLKDIYNSKDFKVTYSTVKYNYNLYGEKALDPLFYNEYHLKSKIADLWLDGIEQKLKYSILREYKIPELKIFADGFDYKTNTVYEFYGDFWHGNPEVFDMDKLNPSKKIAFGELYYKTIDRENKLKKLNYNVVSIWENKFIKTLN